MNYICTIFINKTMKLLSIRLINVSETNEYEMENSQVHLCWEFFFYLIYFSENLNILHVQERITGKRFALI